MKNFRALLLLALTLLAQCVYARSAPKVVLLTALDPKSGKSFLDGANWNGNQVLEALFRKRFENSGFEIEVHHQTDSQTLWNALHAADTAGVFFVGHSAPEGTYNGNNGIVNGISEEAIIADLNGNNLQDIFTDVHPNIRYLAIVGCNAKAIFDSFTAQGFYKNNPGLRIFSFDHLVDPFDFPIELSWNSGLTQAINASLDTLAKPQTYADLFPDGGSCDLSDSTFPYDDSDDPSVKSCEQHFVTHRKVLINPAFASGLPQSCYFLKGLKVTIGRDLKSAQTGAPMLRIVSQGKTLGVLPALASGESQSVDVYFDSSQLASVIVSGGDPSEFLKITADTGLSLVNAESIAIGKLSIQPSWSGGAWSPIADPQGHPLGVTENIYRYKGSVPSVSEGAALAVTYSPFTCE